MKIQKLSYSQKLNSKYNLSQGKSNITFARLLPPDTCIKMMASDLDGTLLAGTQEARNLITKHTDILVYATARTLERVKPLIDKSVLKLPNFLITEDGASIFKQMNGSFHEIASWSQKTKANYNKNIIFNIMADIAKENKMDKHLFPKTEQDRINDPFAYSMIKEYDAFNSDFYKGFFIAPGLSSKKLISIIQKKLKDSSMHARISFREFPKENMTLNGLQKYYSKEKAMELSENFKNREHPNGSAHVIILSANTEKGNAVEHIRKSLNIKTNEVLAAGDAENDISMLKKGYNFAVIKSNETESLEKAISKLKNKSKIFYPKQEGADGILEVLV